MAPWDQWLATEIQTRSANSARQWLNAYLQSPTYHFVAGPDCITSAQHQPMAGVLMPSVDKVGRYFPLAICTLLPALPNNIRDTAVLMQWLQQLDDIAANALHEDWSIAAFEDALTLHPAPTQSPTATTEQADILTLPNQPDIYEAMTLHQPCHVTSQRLTQAWSPVDADSSPKSWWWKAPTIDFATPSISVYSGLPQGIDFASLWGIPSLLP